MTRPTIILLFLVALLCLVLFTGCTPDDDSSSSDGDSPTDGDGTSDGDSDDPANSNGLTIASVVVVADDGGNLIANPGEEVHVRVSVRNSGTQRIEGLNGSLASSSPYVTMTCGMGVALQWVTELEVNGVQALGSTMSSCFTSGTFSMTLSAETPENTILPFTLILSDYDMNSYRLTFSLTVGATSTTTGMVFDSIEVLSDSNSDDLVSPGELAELRITLRNAGTETYEELQGSIQSKTEGIVILCGEAVISDSYYYSISPGDTVDLKENEEDCYTNGTTKIQVSPNVAPNTKASFEINLTDDQNGTHTVTAQLTIVEPQGDLVFDSVQVISDANNDKIVNPGEEAQVKVFVRNDGTARINPLSGTLTSDSDYVTILCGEVVKTRWDYAIEPEGREWLQEDQENCYSDGTMKIKVAQNTPPDTLIPFTLQLTDPEQNIYQVPFSITVLDAGGALAFESVEITRDSNNDHIVNPGEEAELKVTITNTGASRITALNGTLQSSSEYVTILCGEVVKTYSDYSLEPEESQFLVEAQSDCMNYSSFSTAKIQIDPATPAETSIPFMLNLSDQEGNVYQIPFAITVQEPGGELAFDSLEILTDSNNDDLLSPGEWADVRIFVTNTGSSRITPLNGTLMSTSPYVTFLCGEVVKVYNDYQLEPDERQYLAENESDCTISGSMKIQLEQDTPIGAELPFILNMADEQGHGYRVEFSMTVQQNDGLLEYDRLEILNDTNNDHILTPGERGDVKVYVENTGTARITNLIGALSTTSNYATIECGHQIHVDWDRVLDPGDIQMLSEYDSNCSCSGTMKVTISSSAPQGQSIPFRADLYDREGQLWSVSFSLTVQ